MIILKWEESFNGTTLNKCLCGDDPRIVKDRNPPNQIYKCTCIKCGVGTRFYSSFDDARVNWNIMTPGQIAK
jgi:hypothetical protein